MSSTPTDPTASADGAAPSSSGAPSADHTSPDRTPALASRFNAPMSHPARRRLVIIAATAVSMLVVTFAWHTTRLPRETRATAAPTRAAAATPSPAEPSWFAEPGLTTVQRLTQFAAQVQDADTDALTGRYTCRRLQSWGRQTTDVHREDVTLCRNRTDGSGLEFGRTLPNRPGLLPLPDGSDRPLSATAPLYIQHHAAGEYGLVPEPVPTDPAELTDAVLMHHPERLAQAGQEWLVRQLMHLLLEQYLDRPHRAAALRALAGVQGLAFAGPMTDIAGRSGMAFTLSAPNGLYTSIFNPQTGQVLAFIEVVPETRSIKTIRPGLWGYDLLLDLRRQELLPGPSGSPT